MKQGSRDQRALDLQWEEYLAHQRSMSNRRTGRRSIPARPPPADPPEGELKRLWYTMKSFEGREAIYREGFVYFHVRILEAGPVGALIELIPSSGFFNGRPARWSVRSGDLIVDSISIREPLLSVYILVHEEIVREVVKLVAQLGEYGTEHPFQIAEWIDERLMQ